MDKGRGIMTEQAKGRVEYWTRQLGVRLDPKWVENAIASDPLTSVAKLMADALRSVEGEFSPGIYPTSPEWSKQVRAAIAAYKKLMGDGS